MNILNNGIFLCHFLLWESSDKRAVFAGIFTNPAEKGGVTWEEHVVRFARDEAICPETLSLCIRSGFCSTCSGAKLS